MLQYLIQAPIWKAGICLSWQGGTVQMRWWNKYIWQGIEIQQYSAQNVNSSNFCLKVTLVANKLISERGNASFPSFVRWLVSKVSIDIVIVITIITKDRTNHQRYHDFDHDHQDHKDVCFKKSQSADCAMNPHWAPLQARWQLEDLLFVRFIKQQICFCQISDCFQVFLLHRAWQDHNDNDN